MMMKSLNILFVIMLVSISASAQSDLLGRKAEGEYYTGDVFIKPLGFTNKQMTTQITFAPGARNDWQIHPEAVQLCILASGTGFYQEEGSEVKIMHAGDMIKTPAGVKHWNGAVPNDTAVFITVSDIVPGKDHVVWVGSSKDAYETTVQRGNMVIHIADIEIYPEFAKQYIKAATIIGETSMRVEPGVISLFPMVDKENPNHIQIVEVYVSKAAYQSHLKTEHFITYKTETASMVKNLKLIDMDAMNPAIMSVIFNKAK